MAIALTNWKLYGTEMSEGVSPNAIQYLEMDVTGANSDVAVDLADWTPGTWWTSALAHGTYGTVAAQALKALKNIVNSGVALKDFVIPEITWAKLRAGSTGAGSYTMTYTAASLCCSITCHTTDAPTAYKVIIGLVMKPEYVVKTGSYTVSGWVGTV
jgi:hypothetical protein